LENIVKPKLMDRKLGMHPLLLFFAILGGLTEFGFTGVILGPLFVTLFMTIWSIYHIWESSPAQRELPQKN
ncbi:MAG: AI-2E family transporter, partial [Leptospiraceae bacterium]|nr:AI-2E family transporter [Leptospiraceae bacterium]